MSFEDVLEEIEEELKKTEGDGILEICETFFDEESFSDEQHLDEGMIEDMFNIIIDEVTSNKDTAEKIYLYLFDEKITIDEDEFYSEEELEYE